MNNKARLLVVVAFNNSLRSQASKYLGRGLRIPSFEGAPVGQPRSSGLISSSATSTTPLRGCTWRRDSHNKDDSGSSRSRSSSSSSHSSQPPRATTPWMLWSLGWGLFSSSDPKRLSSEELVDLSLRASQKGNAAEAKQHARTAIKKDPHNWQAYQALAFAFIIEYNWQKAVAAFEKGIYFLTSKRDAKDLVSAVKLLDILANFYEEMCLFNDTEALEKALEARRRALSLFAETKGYDNNSDPHWNHFDIILKSNLAGCYTYSGNYEMAHQLCAEVEEQLTALQESTSASLNGAEYLARLKAEWIIAREDLSWKETQTPISDRDFKELYQDVPLKDFEAQMLILELNRLDRASDDDNTAAKRHELIEKAISTATQLEEFSYVKEQDTMSYLRRRSYWNNRALLPYLHWIQAEFLCRRKKFIEASEELLKVMKFPLAAPIHNKAQCTVAKMMLENGDVKRGLVLIEKALKTSKSPQLSELKARFLLRQLKFVEAKRELELEIRKFPNNANAYYLLNQLNRGMKLFNEAADVCQDALKVIEKNSKPEINTSILFLIDLAKNHALLGEFEDAKKDIEKAMALDSTNHFHPELQVLTKTVAESQQIMESSGMNLFEVVYNKMFTQFQQTKNENSVG